jgi:4-amino-4-deoxy-L-arabinose transferase-like glycosyltransferase
VAILSAFVALALAYSVVIPLGEAPDEVSHWAYVQYLVQYRRLPPLEGAVLGQAHQPPLYYILGALLTGQMSNPYLESIANPDWDLQSTQVNNLLLHPRQEAFPYRDGALAWHWVRWLTIALGGITVWATYQLALQLFPANISIAVLAAALVAFLPQFTFLSAVVNNDNAVIAFAALMLVWFLRLSRSSPLAHAAVLGLVLGMAILCKFQAAILAPVIFLALFFRLDGMAFRERIQRILLALGVTMIVVSPWVIYNTIVFRDPFSMERFFQVWSRTAPLTWDDWIVYASRTYWSFWGKVGGVTNVTLSPITYIVLPALFAIGGIGAVCLFNDWRTQGKRGIAPRGFVVIGGFWILLAASHIRMTLSVVGLDQARQIFIALPSLGVVIAGGIMRLIPRWQNQIVGTIVVILVLIGFANVPVVASAYAPVYALPSPASSGGVDYGDTIRVNAFTLDRTRAQPGESIRVQVEWQALEDIHEDYWLLLQLVGKDGIVANKDGVPSAGRVTTDWWRQGQTFESSHAFAIPTDLTPGIYSLRLGLHPFKRWEWLPVRDVEMLTLATIVVENPR